MSLMASPASTVLAPPLETSVAHVRPTPARWPWIVAAGGAVLVVVTVLWASTRDQQIEIADAGTAVLVDAFVDAGVLDDAAGLPPGTVELAGDAGVAVDAGPLADAGEAAHDSDVDAAAGAPVMVDAGVRVVRPRRPPPPPAPPAPPADVVEEQGFLTLDTVPWTTVYLGKKKLGETPLVKVPVPAGSLELTLVNSEAGVREAYIARIKPGEIFKTRLDLQ